MVKKPITQPSLEEEQLLEEILSGISSPEENTAIIRNKKIHIPVLNGHARRKITAILLGKGKEECVPHKCLAAARLNGYFKIKFLWRILWRWYFYIRQYGDEELTEVIDMIKKKVPVEGYLKNTISLIEMRETMMQMTRAEVFRIAQERKGASNGKSAKSNRGSQDRSAS